MVWGVGFRVLTLNPKPSKKRGRQGERSSVSITKSVSSMPTLSCPGGSHVSKP